MAKNDNQSQGKTGGGEPFVKNTEEFLNKITVANFVRYVGPGVVLFGLVKVSKVPSCLEIANAFKADKESSTFLILLFLIGGSLVHTAYRAFIYNKLIVSLKDRNMLKKRNWLNFREVLRIQCSNLGNTEKKFLDRIKLRYESDWVWRRLKLKFFKSGYGDYDPGMALWSSSIHLLYFTGISSGIFFFLELIYGDCGRSVLYLFGGILSFLAGLWADTEYERAETYIYEKHIDRKKLDVYLQELFTFNAFQKQKENGGG
jgi:hypothetical protein